MKESDKNNKSKKILFAAFIIFFVIILFMILYYKNNSKKVESDSLEEIYQISPSNYPSKVCKTLTIDEINLPENQNCLNYCKNLIDEIKSIYGPLYQSDMKNTIMMFMDLYNQGYVYDSTLSSSTGETVSSVTTTTNSVPTTTPITTPIKTPTPTTQKACFACGYTINQECDLALNSAECQKTSGCKWENNKCNAVSDSCPMKIKEKCDGMCYFDSVTNQCINTAKWSCEGKLKIYCKPPADKIYDSCKIFPIPPSTLGSIEKWFEDNKCNKKVYVRIAHGSPENDKQICNTLSYCIKTKGEGLNDYWNWGCYAGSKVGDIYKNFKDIIDKAKKEGKYLEVELTMYLSQCQVFCTPDGNTQWSATIKFIIYPNGSIKYILPPCPPTNIDNSGIGRICDFQIEGEWGDVYHDPVKDTFYCMKDDKPICMGCGEVHENFKLPEGTKTIATWIEMPMSVCEKIQGPLP